MPACSPTKWHRGHTTWFFETFVLAPHGVAPWSPGYCLLFNSYYEAVGPRHPRPRRGLLSRPTAAEVGEWRRQVDHRVDHLLATLDHHALEAVAPLVTLGLAHEEQHQELLLTDILHAFSHNPLQPAYRAASAPAAPHAPGPRPEWVSFDEGVVSVGAPGGTRGPGGHRGFNFDNEAPRHRVHLTPYALATRLVTVGDMRAFVEAGGYDTPSLWLYEGLEFVRAHGLRAPGYVTIEDGVWHVFDLCGRRRARDDEPVAHLSFYEADALARFLGARLPTEPEWENAADATPEMDQLYDQVWQWTSSAYTAYPGYIPAAGAVGEYNGKFMVNQMVLRGGSRFTPPGHSRSTYRNFWHPDTRFQVTGLRLARDVP